MESLYAIGFGLALRYLVDSIADSDLRIVSTLVGLWEGVITLYFLKKLRKSWEPYIAYALRLFIDLVVTMDPERMVLVILWTGVGMILADVTPVIWTDVGLNRTWRRFRRDMYTITRRIPTALFPRQRTVRFSPVTRRPSTIIEEDEPSENEQAPTPSAVSTTLPHATLSIPISMIGLSTAGSSVRSQSRRVVPGFYPTSTFSESETDAGSRRGGRGFTTQDDDSFSERSSTSTRPSRSTTTSATNTPSADMDDLPDIPEQEETQGTPTQTLRLLPVEELTVAPLNATVQETVEEKPETPRQPRFTLPPTPSDSAVRWRKDRELVADEEEVKPVPSSASLPHIPDEAVTPDPWVKVDGEERPPTPPGKDRPTSSAWIKVADPGVQAQLRQVVPEKAKSDSAEEDMHYDGPDNGAAAAAAVAAEQERLAREVEERRAREQEEAEARRRKVEEEKVERARKEAEDDALRQARREELRRKEEEEERQRAAEEWARKLKEDEERLRAAEELARKLKEEEEERQHVAEELVRKLKEEEERQRVAAEWARKLKEDEEEAERKRIIEQERQREEEEREAKREAKRKRKAEEQRLKEEQAQREEKERLHQERLKMVMEGLQRKEEEEKRQRERVIEEALRAVEAQRLAILAAEEARLKEEERLKEEAARKIEEERLAAEAEALRLRLEAEAAVAAQKAAEEEVERLRLEAEEKEREAEAERLRLVEETRKAEEERQRLETEEAERQRLAAEEAERQRLEAEEAERKRLEVEEAERKRLTEEAERQRIAEAEAEAERQRLAKAEAEAEAERQRIAVAEAEAERKRLAEEEAERQRIAEAEAEAERKRIAEVEAEAERQRIAEAEAERKRIAEEEAERKRIAEEEAERERLEEEEAERQRLAEEELERQRIAEAEAERARIAEEETERKRLADAEEAERLRIAEAEAEAERKRIAEEAEEAKRQAEEQAKAEELLKTTAEETKREAEAVIDSIFGNGTTEEPAEASKLDDILPPASFASGTGAWSGAAATSLKDEQPANPDDLAREAEAKREVERIRQATFEADMGAKISTTKKNKKKKKKASQSAQAADALDAQSPVPDSAATPVDGKNPWNIDDVDDEPIPVQTPGSALARQSLAFEDQLRLDEEREAQRIAEEKAAAEGEEDKPLVDLGEETKVEVQEPEPEPVLEVDDAKIADDIAEAEPLAQSSDEPVSGETDEDRLARERELVDLSDVRSQVSAAPHMSVTDRLHKMILQRAQMVQLYKRVKELSAKDDEASRVILDATIQALGKFQRKYEKRWSAGVADAEYITEGHGNVDDPQVTLEGIKPTACEAKVEEKIERLLSSTARSLEFSILLAKKVLTSQKQRAKITNLLDSYALTPYASEDGSNKKITYVSVSEEDFDAWLAAYRARTTQN